MLSRRWSRHVTRYTPKYSYAFAYSICWCTVVLLFLLIGYLKGCVKKVIQMFVAFSFKLDYTFCELKSCNFISSGLRSIAGIDFCMSGIISMNIEHICWLHTLIAWILTIDFVCLNFVMLFCICPSRFRWDLSATALYLLYTFFSLVQFV